MPVGEAESPLANVLGRPAIGDGGMRDVCRQHFFNLFRPGASESKIAIEGEMHMLEKSFPSTDATGNLRRQRRRRVEEHKLVHGKLPCGFSNRLVDARVGAE